ncbi:MAG: MBL fold metallo-hydrolase [Cyanothece sp. SIO2G6]|nr:MBL fold metallo-hydrolase [Cyanothece sp. SIO2G6]
MALHPVVKSVYAFAPNRTTMGGTAYFATSAEGNILIDCPAWNTATENTLDQCGGVRWLVITHRGGIGGLTLVKQIQARYDCEVVIQEQEAYLLPELSLQTFQHDLVLFNHCRLLWTPGHSPGSSCLYFGTEGGILFTGRHLLPNAQGELVPLRVAKTFHWLRQLRSVQRLRDEFSLDTLQLCCPGANTGFLRKQRVVRDTYQKLLALDLDALKTLQPNL